MNFIALLHVPFYVLCGLRFVRSGLFFMALYLEKDVILLIPARTERSISHKTTARIIKLFKRRDRHIKHCIVIVLLTINFLINIFLTFKFKANHFLMHPIA